MIFLEHQFPPAAWRREALLGTLFTELPEDDQRAVLAMLVDLVETRQLQGRLRRQCDENLTEVRVNLTVA